MQKFFTNTLINKFIKQLLRNTPIPLYDTVAIGSYIIKDCTYIFRYNIIRCTRSGYITETPEETSGLFDIIKPYAFGTYDPKITEKFISKYSYYDSETHQQLGQYLRCIRDIYEIDLMPFYNCFSYKTVANIDLTNSFPYIGNTSDRVIFVPIKFNKTYTIAMDCPSEVKIRSIIYDQYGIVNLSNSAIPNYLTQYLDPEVITYQNLSFSQPITYSISIAGNNDQVSSKIDPALSIASSTLYNYQKYLYLAIQYPAEVTTSIAVLEGDYTQNTTSTIINAENITSITSQYLNNICLSKLSLLSFNNRAIYAFSDRLVEYLLLNVITSQETISNNITRVQENIGLPILYQNAGIWSNDIRYYIYSNYISKNLISKKIPVTDINGFIDVDIERALMRGELS